LKPFPPWSAHCGGPARAGSCWPRGAFGSATATWAARLPWAVATAGVRRWPPSWGRRLIPAACCSRTRTTGRSYGSPTARDLLEPQGP